MSTEALGPKPRVRTLADSRRWELAVAGVVLLAGLGVAGWFAWGYYHWRQALHASEAPDFPKAREHLARCLKVWSNSGEVQLLLARVCRRAGDFEAARAALKLADQNQADTAELDLEILLLHAEDGDVLTAQRLLYPRVQARDRHELLILEALTKGCLKAHYLPEAVHWAELWLERRPDDLEALYLRGLALKTGQLLPQSEGLELAKRDFRRVLERKPDHDDARRLLAELLELAGVHDEALQHYTLYRQKRPDDPTALVGQVRCLQGLGRITEARKALDDWFARRSDAPAEAYVLRARIELEEDGNPHAALAWLRKAVALASHHDDAHHNLAIVLHRLSEHAEAEQHEEKCREIRRTLERLRNVSMEIAKKGEGADLRLEAGRLQMQLGDPNRARLWWLSALQDDPYHQETHKVLAELYEKQGNRAQAAEHRALAQGVKPQEKRTAGPRRR